MDNCNGFFSLLCLGRAATVQTYHPTKKRSIFSFLSPVFGEHPPNHAEDKGSEESIVQRPNGQVRSFRWQPSRPSFSTCPCSIVHCCDRSWPDRWPSRTMANAAPTACRMPVYALVQSIKQASAVCRKCFMKHFWQTAYSKIHAIDRDRGEFPSVAIDRVDLYLLEVLPWLNFTPDTQQVQAERFSFLLGVTCALAPGTWRSTAL